MIDKLKNITKNINKYLFLHLKNKWIKRFKINKDDYYIVSLGWNCLSRSLPTEWGLKKRKEEGETSEDLQDKLHRVRGRKDHNRSVLFRPISFCRGQDVHSRQNRF